MTTPATRSRRAAGRALKSPLAVPGTAAASHDPAPGSLALAPARTALTDREETLAEFQGYLRTVNNRDGRPYEQRTITAYSDPAKSLDRWMTANGIDGDFTVVDTATLNRYFREYYLEQDQGGTHTQQRNLIHLFNFPERERGVATSYADGLDRYAAVKGHPKTLSGEFIDDLLEVTGGGRARDLETARDHAIIRILRSDGIRRMELLSMVMHTSTSSPRSRRPPPARPPTRTPPERQRRPGSWAALYPGTVWLSRRLGRGRLVLRAGAHSPPGSISRKQRSASVPYPLRNS